MIDTWLSKLKIKQSYEGFIKKVLLGKVSANQLTLLGLIIGIFSAITIYLGSLYPQFFVTFYVFSIIFTVSSFFIDTLDGAIARLEGVTIFGGILDIFSDRLVEVSILISIISTDVNLIWPGLFSLASIILCISMFLIVGGLLNTTSNSTKPNQKVIKYRLGLMERSETFLFLLLLIILYPWRLLILWLFGLLVFLTALLRLIDAYRIFCP